MRARLSQCPDCAGQGAVPFETGRPAEPCPRCHGTGREYNRPEFRELFDAMIAEREVFASPDWRLLLEGLSALEQRIETLEQSER